MPHQLQVYMPRVLQCSFLAVILYYSSYGLGLHPLAAHAHGHAKLMPTKAHVQLESLLGSPAAPQTTWSKPAFGILHGMAQVTPKLPHPIPTCPLHFLPPCGCFVDFSPSSTTGGKRPMPPSPPPQCQQHWEGAEAVVHDSAAETLFSPSARLSVCQRDLGGWGGEDRCCKCSDGTEDSCPVHSDFPKQLE
jgi:hypothetical protein